MVVAAVRNASRTPEGWLSAISSWGSGIWARAQAGSR